MILFKKKRQEKIAQLSYLFNIVTAIKIELNTRSLYQLDNHNEAFDKCTNNIQELFNDIFIINENLRNLLKSIDRSKCFIYGRQIDSIIAEVESFISDLLNFQSNWNTSYTLWLSSFKSHKENRDVVTRGYKKVQQDFQILFPDNKNLFNDIYDLIETCMNTSGKMALLSYKIGTHIDCVNQYFYHKVKFDV